VLTDGHGLDLLRELKRRHPGLRSIVLTALVDPDTEAQALTAGADLFVPKPFDPEALLADIARLMPG
jgi:DNA-binding response OmpR family regulator